MTEHSSATVRVVSALGECRTVQNGTSEISSNNLLLSSHEVNSLLKKTVYKLKKSKSAIPSCSRHLARVIYKLHLIHGTLNIYRM